MGILNRTSHSKDINMRVVLFLIFFIISNLVIVYGDSYPFENKEYVNSAEIGFSFSEGVFKYINYWYEQWGEAGLDFIPITQSGKYTIHETAGHIIAEVLIDNIKRRIFVFYEGDHVILYDTFLERTVYGSYRSRDESYLYPVGKVDASSFFSEVLAGKEVKYLPENLSSRDITKQWVEGVKGVGVGEKLFIGPFHSPGVNHLVIMNGFFSPKQPELFKDNGRIRRFILRGYDENGVLSYQGEKILDDTANLQLVKSAIRCVSFEIEIIDVYDGRRFEDTAVSGIFLDGFLVSDSIR